MNDKGGKVTPGQTKRERDADVETAEPFVTAKQARSPNDNWTATDDDVDFTSATITVVQVGKWF